MSAARPILILAGGTGGHVFPALAVAEELRRRGAPVVWFGTPRGLEARVAPAAGFPFETLALRAPGRPGAAGVLRALPRLAAAVLRGLRLLAAHRPASALGMGGYASAPGALAALLRRVPLAVHEQNARAGLTNRLLARLAARTLTGFARVEGLRPGYEYVGNPVRAALQRPAAPVDAAPRPLRLLVVGGSQGARFLNRAAPAALRELAPEEQPEVWHQHGAGDGAAELRARYPDGAGPRLSAFIDDMGAAYAWADLVLARAGAGTLAELACAGRAALLVPYPHAAGGHQAENARRHAAAGAARTLAQADCAPARLAAALRELGADRARLRAMGAAAGRLARPRAAAAVAERLLELAA